MSSVVFPTLRGLGWNIVRTTINSTGVKKAVSGASTRLRFWAYPMYRWELNYDFLYSVGTQDYQALLSFFNLMGGAYDSFLYDCVDDDTVTGQLIGTGDGSTLSFQLYRTLGSFTEPVLAPNTVSNVYVNGSPVTFTVTSWSAQLPGVVTLASAPALNALVTADFTYYWPVRFTDDTLDISAFAKSLYEVKKIDIESVRN